MVTESIIVVVITVLLMLGNTQKTSGTVNVTISLGNVTGLHVVRGNIEYYSFRGIPYANATTRFKAPVPMKSWTSVVMATEDGLQCAQPPMFGMPPSTPIEDCLFLNVFTPQLPQPGQLKLPVMVFIHGGGYIGGSSNSYLHGPEFFMAEKNVILVSFNYRLGIFGFLSTGTKDAQGNAGMKDQVEALKFVKNEISYFGGDPSSITIFGVSAGASSVVHHVLSPMSKGLFHRAIAESGTALSDWSFVEASVANEHATKAAKILGCNTENATTVVKCLSEMSASALCQASVSAGQESLMGFVPVIEKKFDEEVFLADYPQNVLNNLTKAVPLIIGTNKDEGMLMVTDNDNQYASVDKNLQYFAPRSVLKQATKDRLSTIAQQVRSYYFNNGTVNRTNLKGYVDLNTDYSFMYPAARTVRKLVENKNVVYLYHFAYSGGYKVPNQLVTRLGYKGVAHGEDMGYLFYSTSFNNTNLTQTGTQDYQTMKRMVKLWTSFAVYGVPDNRTDAVIKDIHWPKITNASELNYLEMETSFTPAKDYYKERIALWDRLCNLQTSSALQIEPTALLLTVFSLFFILKSCKFS